MTRISPPPPTRALAWTLLALLPLACVASSDDDPATTDAGATTSASSATAPSSSEGSESSSDGSETTGGSDPTTSDGDTTLATAGSSESGLASGSESGSACGDVQSDPMNCGACGTVCGAPSHAEATCDAAVCDVECSGGYDEVDVGGSTRCSKFAGFFLLRETGTCEAENPFTGDCSCPSGFDDRPVTSWRISPSDGTSWVQLAACSPVAGDPTDAWGGMFAEYEDGGACAFPNPLEIPLCVCPDGYTVTSQWRGANINGDAIRVSFCTEDTFEDDALFVGAFTEASGGGCATSDCTCPAGATRVDYPTVFSGAATTSAFCYWP
jgi:hypothetical protein